MRERLRPGVTLACLVTLAGVAALAQATEPAPPTPTGEVHASLDAKLAVIARTDRLLADKYQQRALALERRVRASYKLLRAGWAPLWFDPDRRAAVVQRRALVKRALARASAELALLRAEVTTAARARAYLEGARRAAARARAPAPGTLLRPVVPGSVVSAAGIYRHPTGARLTRRGVELGATPGAAVHSVAAGIVRHAGPVRGLGVAVVLDHDGYRSVLAGLSESAARPGSSVAEGAFIGRAAGDHVYLEIRLDTGGGGHPIDPVPLLEPLSE